MSGTVTAGLPARPLAFAEMGTYGGTDAEIILTPFWAHQRNERVDETGEANRLVAIVCAHPGGVSALGFDPDETTWNTVITRSTSTDFDKVWSLLDVIEQWLFERYSLDELVPITTDPMEFVGRQSGLDG